MLWAVLLGAAVELWSVVMSMGTKLNCGDLVAKLILIVLLFFFFNHRLSKLCATENCTYFALSFFGSIILKILDSIFS